MTKSEFLNLLDKKLVLIAEDERKDILMEYGTYIDDKVTSGFSEEDAVEGFGNVDDLVQDILEAYKINTDSVHSKMDRTLDKVYNRSESFLNKAGNLSMNDIFHLIFDAFVLLLILMFFKLILVDLFSKLFLDLLFGLAGGYLYGFRNLIIFLLNVVYFLGSIFFFFTIMIRRFERYKNKTAIRKVGVIEDIKSTWNQEARELVPSIDKTKDLPPIPGEDKPLYHNRTAKLLFDEHTKCIIIKIMLVLVSIPLVLFFIGFVVAFVLLVYISLVKQASSIGMYLILLGCIGGTACILWLFSTLWPKGVNQDA